MPNWQHPATRRFHPESRKGDSEDPDIAPLYEEAIRDTIPRFEATGDSTRLFK
jgi:hypothetical protein